MKDLIIDGDEQYNSASVTVQIWQNGSPLEDESFEFKTKSASSKSDDGESDVFTWEEENSFPGFDVAANGKTAIVFLVHGDASPSDDESDESKSNDLVGWSAVYPFGEGKVYGDRRRSQHLQLYKSPVKPPSVDDAEDAAKALEKLTKAEAAGGLNVDIFPVADDAAKKKRKTSVMSALSDVSSKDESDRCV